MEEFFIAGINYEEKISKVHNKYISGLDYSNKAFLVFPGACSGDYLSSFTAAICTSFGSGSANVGIVFSYQ